MTARQPIDPLDDQISEFLQAVDSFLTMNVGFETPVPIASNPDGGWDEVKRVWEEGKQAFRKMHASFMGVQPAVNEKLEDVSAKGSIILGLTEDPHIIDPVNELMGLASEVRREFDRFGSALGKAASVLGFVSLILELSGMKTRLVPLSTRIVAARDNLIAYNLMRPRPPESA